MSIADSGNNKAFRRSLGMDRPITRRDFLNASLLGAGALLLELPSPMRLFAQAPDWDGYGGEGVYAASHGNTEEVVRAAHGIRDSRYSLGKAIDTGENYDLVVVGGGLSGLGAAFHFRGAKKSGQKCIVLENHPLFGGEAKRNEFSVDGVRLIGPQGSNSFVVIDGPGAGGYDLYSELGLPRTFRYQEMQPSSGRLHFDRTNYGFMLWYDASPNFGYYFPGEPAWVKDPWGGNLAEAPFSEKTKKDFLRWRSSAALYYAGDDFESWLDSMTYKEYLEKIMRLGPEVARFVDPVLASSIGLGSDAISAFGAYQVSMPGFQGFPRGFTRKVNAEASDWHSFPGGNDGIVRHLLKALIPGAIRGGRSFGDIINGRIEFEALDRPGNEIRMRLGALAVGVEHDGDPGRSYGVRLTYVRDQKMYSLSAKGVIMACGGLISRRIVAGLPGEHADAYRNFHYSPVMIVNVALTNWRFLYSLGLTACRWFEGFGFSCNIRRPMIAGDYKPPLDPGRPALLTFYVPFYYPGLNVREQGGRGRRELLSTSFLEYETKIREQMIRLFGKAGFNPGRDIAGIVLNRWGHAFVNPQPGFYFGKDGKAAPRSVIRKPFGRIAFAHSELNGHQHWLGAVEEGRRAAKQVLALI